VPGVATSRGQDKQADIALWREGPGDPSARASSIRWVRLHLQGQRHGVACTTRSGEPRACSTGSGVCAWRGPNGCGRTPGRKSQTSARPPGRSTRPISARPAAGSAQWCIDNVLTTRSNDASGNASEATSPTRNDGLQAVLASHGVPDAARQSLTRKRPGRRWQLDGLRGSYAISRVFAPNPTRGRSAIPAELPPVGTPPSLAGVLSSGARPRLTRRAAGRRPARCGCGAGRSAEARGPPARPASRPAGGQSPESRFRSAASPG
jgi:hypothetical protein